MRDRDQKSEMRNSQVHPGNWIWNQATGCPNLGDPAMCVQATESGRKFLKLDLGDWIVCPGD